MSDCQVASMKRTASDLLVDTLPAWGVDVVFGLPGDGINGIMEALRKQQEAVRLAPGDMAELPQILNHILGRFEQS